MRIAMRNVLKLVYRAILFPLVKKKQTKDSSQIPKYELQEIHVRNTRILPDREELLKILPKSGVVAELGVDEGNFSESILTLNTPEKLHLIDCWSSKRYNQNKRKKIEKKFAGKIEKGDVVINIGLSTKIVDMFEDNYFDWIYIDTSHSYKTTICELEKYHKKVKQNGIIAGHDYILGNWNGLVRYGVIEAVSEFCIKYNWEVLFLTTELNIPPSFALRKITDDKNVYTKQA